MEISHDQLYAAASRYYVQGETMDTIARSLGVSRSSVSRLLAQARETGVVRITLTNHGAHSPEAQRLADAFGIRVHVVPVGDAAAPGVRFEKVAREAAALLDDVMADDLSLGVAWGRTVSQVARHLAPKPLHGVMVVQVNGSATSEDAALPFVGSILQTIADAYGARVHLFPVPAFFDHAATKWAMWKERSVQHVLEKIRLLDVVLFGVGSLTGRVPSHVYTSGYFDAAELLEIERAGVVGDVCTVLLREDGTWDGIRFNDCATGPTPEVLRSIPRRICVVADPRRAPAVVGALRAGAVTDLVCDDSTVASVLRRV